MPFLSEPGEMVMTDILGCKHHDLVSVMKFDPDNQYVGVTSSLFHSMLTERVIREKRYEFEIDSRGNSKCVVQQVINK